MAIAILADIHDHVWNLERALVHVRDADAVLCCGDLCSPFVLARLGEGVRAPVHVVFGNNDGDLYRLTEAAGAHGHVHLHGAFFRGRVAGARVAMTHYPDVAAALDPEAADLIAYGHDHTFHVARRGAATVVNPGTLMGHRPSDRADVPATFVLYDPETGAARGLRLSGAGEALPYPE